MSANAFTSYAYGRPSFSSPPEKDFFSSLSGFTLPVSLRARQHLVKVYSTLFVTVACAAVGCLAHLRFGIGGALTHIASVLLLIALAAATHGGSPSPSTWLKGVQNSQLLLCAFGFTQGASIGPLVQLALYLDPALLLTAFVLTANIFLCFSLTALYVPKRSTLALAAILSSSLSFLCVLSLLSLFWPTVWAFKLQLYLGLLVFCGLIIVDTNSIIDSAERGEADCVRDALRLFTNVVAIFVRVLIILMENSRREDNNDRRRKTVRR